jgi:hypothetical protein
VVEFKLRTAYAAREIPGIGVDPATSGHTAHITVVYYFYFYYFYPTASCTASTCQLDVGFVTSIDGGRGTTFSLTLSL